MGNVRDNMRKALEQAGTTRYQLAKRTGIDQAALSRFLAGRPGLSLENLEKLADALGLEIIIRPKRKAR